MIVTVNFSLHCFAGIHNGGYDEVLESVQLPLASQED